MAKKAKQQRTRRANTSSTKVRKVITENSALVSTEESTENKNTLPTVAGGTPPALNLDDQKALELAEESEANEAQADMAGMDDAITRAFAMFHKIDLASYFQDWHVAGMPTGEGGAQVTFERFYIYMKTVIEVHDKGTTGDTIMARKSLAEAMGYRYTWLMEDELNKGIGNEKAKTDGKVFVSFKELFEQRIKPMKKKMPWPFQQVRSLGTVVDGGKVGLM